MAANLEGEEEVKRLAHWLEHTVPLYLTDDDDPCPPGIREQLVKAATILRASSPSGRRIEGQNDAIRGEPVAWWVKNATSGRVTLVHLESQADDIIRVLGGEKRPLAFILHSEVRTPE